MNIKELRDGLAYVEALLANIHTAAAERSFTPDEDVAWKTGVEYVESTRAAIKAYEDRDAIIARNVAAGSADAGDAGVRNVPNFNRTTSTEDVINSRSASPSQINDAVVREVEAREVDPTYLRKVLKRHGSDTAWSRDLLVRSTDVYGDAWTKCIMGREAFLSSEERAAISATTAANGGYLVPTHLDPTIILTSAGSSNVIRQMGRVVTLTEGNVWNGVTSAGVTASYDAALAEVSDDSPTFGAAAVTVHKAQAFVQATIEAFEDINSLASDVLMLFADAKDVLEGSVFATGTGDGQPFGIYTALDANTNVEVTSTTAATIGLVDLQGLRRAVPQRFRGRGSWLMAPVYADAIKTLGTALSASYSTDITQANTTMLLGSPLVESDDAPTTQTTTVKDNEIVFGDFSNYVIVDKPGSTAIEFIPHLFATASNLPDGRRGWYMHWRNGADSVNDVAFRLLQDKTSA